MAQVLRQEPKVGILTVSVPDAFSDAALSLKKRGYPLICICHDDYTHHVKGNQLKLFKALMEHADLKLCVSPNMTAYYRKQYSGRCETLLPIPSGTPEKPRPQDPNAPLIMGYAGSLGNAHVKPILALADALAKHGGKLVVATGRSCSLLPASFSHPAVQHIGTLPPDKVKAAFESAGVNMLVQCQTTSEVDRWNFSMGFPSKFTEYSTYGLPVLALAEDSSSSGQWILQHAGVAELAHHNDNRAIEAAVMRSSSAAHRCELSQKFYEAALEDFDPEKLQKQFESSILECLLNVSVRPSTL